jgi:transcriptional regulator with XRE-family HTH domain
MINKSPITKRLKEARLAAGISQKQLGIAAGIDEFVASARMNQYETGKHTPGFEMLEKIANALNIPTAYFYTSDDLLAQLIATYGKLNITAKKSAFKHIKQLLE